MLRIHPRTSAQGTKDYYKHALSTSDYYTEKGEIIGEWRGQLANEMGLSGEVNETQFNKLCDNINPLTDEKLTKRTNENRRVAYDFTYSAPKAISLAYALNDDPKILEAFQSSYLSSMEEIEKNVEARVRAKGANENRVTGNILFSDYIHPTARPNKDGIPDPHLHSHCVAMNVSHDQIENKNKALELGNIYKKAPYYQAKFNLDFANRLMEVGYKIKRTKDGFGLEGISRKTEKQFSQRTETIEKLAKEKGIISDKEKEKLGARTRKRKSKDYSFDELKGIWKEKFPDDEREGLKPNQHQSQKQEKPSADFLIDEALKRTTQRQSAVREDRLLTNVYQLALGTGLTSDDIEKTLKAKNINSKKTKDGTFYTTQEAIDEEKFLVGITRKGRGKHYPINPNYKIENDQMSKEQKKAVNHVLKSKDLVSVVAGGAGTGKTWSVKEIANGALKAGKRFHAFAPSAAASRGVQVEEGFQNATTIASLLQNKRLQKNIKNGIVWIDEAGMVGNKTMNEILNIANQQNARVLLTGDINQHNSVERGDALRIIQEKAGIKPATIKTIRRQKPKDYRDAVSLLSSGEMEQGFKVLDKIGAIKESDKQEHVFKAASKEYIEARENKQEALIVATTHAQGKAVTNEIRSELKEKNMLQGETKNFATNQATSHTESEKQDHVNYETGQIISFHKPAKGGFVKGRDYQVKEVKDGNIILSDSKGVEKPLNLKESERYTIFNKTNTELLQGDQIRLTKNFTSQDKKRLNNGDILTVDGFTKDGDIKATRGRTSVVIGKEQGHFTHGYYNTSPSSQGKSVNKVIVVQTAASGLAANKEQFYVSASRGKFEISVHTDDKKGMLRNIQRSSERMIALDVGERSIKDRMKEKIDAFKQITRAKISKMKDAIYKKDLTTISSKPIQKPIRNAIRR